MAKLDPGDTALLAEAKAIEDRRRAEEKARRPPPREPAARVGYPCALVACRVIRCWSVVAKGQGQIRGSVWMLGRSCPAARPVATVRLHQKHLALACREHVSEPCPPCCIDLRCQGALSPLPCAAPPVDFAPFPEWPNLPTEEDEASLFDRKLKPLRLGPGVYARGMQTQITGAEILTSVSGGARCRPAAV